MAAIYEVHTCRVPSGAPAPAHGWAPLGAGTIVSIGCPGGKLTVRTPPGTHSPRSRYGVAFSAPSGTRIVGLDAHVEVRIVQVPGGPPPWAWGYSEGGIPVGEGVAGPVRETENSAQDDIVAYSTPKPLSRLDLTLYCSWALHSGDCQDNGSLFSVRRIAVRLDDVTPPRIVSSSGSLLEAAGPQRGMRRLALRLQDTGAGLYRVRVDVDGEQMAELPVDDNDGACKRPFVVPVPCKLAAAIDIPIDTTRLVDGPHTIAVRAFDATGANAATVGPISLTVDNQPDPPPRGTAACPRTNAASVRRQLKTQVVRFGRSAFIVGRVSGSRNILKSARAGIIDNAALSGRPRLARLGKRGRFKIRVRPKQNTRVQAVLVSAAGEARACGKPVRVKVRAGVRFAIRPRHLRNGETIRLGGHVVGRPLPTPGKSVAIMARARGAAAWTTVTRMRTDSRGQFRFVYRFRRTFTTTTYEFRAVVPRERGYPFLRGWSRVRRTTVSP